MFAGALLARPRVISEFVDKYVPFLAPDSEAAADESPQAAKEDAANGESISEAKAGVV